MARKQKQNDSGVLVAALADAPLATPGTIFDRFCNKCGARVMIALSGQAMLKKDPAMTVLCLACFRNGMQQDAQVGIAPAPGAIEEARYTIPNPFRRRN